MATQDKEPDKKHSNVKVYEQKERAGIPAWIWLLPLLLLVALGLWWFNRSHDTQTAQTDQLKPDAAPASAPEGARSRTGSEAWTATGIAETIRRTGRVSLGDAEVHFATGSAGLQGDSQAVLDQVAQALNDNRDWKMRIEGHTDSTGSASANEQLAGQRAEAVATYLSGKGVDRTRLTPVKEYGQRAPKADNASDVGRAENRRVELIKE